MDIFIFVVAFVVSSARCGDYNTMLFGVEYKSESEIQLVATVYRLVVEW